MSGLTFEKRVSYARDMTALGLWHSWRLARAGQDLREAVSRRSPIYRLTSLWDRKHHVAGGWEDAEWEAVLGRLTEAYEQSETSDAFEARGAGLIGPFLEGGARRAVEHWPWIPEGYCVNPLPEDHVYGFFAIEIPKAGDRVGIHLANASMPESPFADPRARLRELGETVAAVGRLAPDRKYLSCATWMNSFPPFLALFPPEWTASLEPRHGRGVGYELWGQFVARDGGFHARNGRKFRETGELPYLSMAGCCRLDVIADHVAAQVKR